MQAYSFVRKMNFIILGIKFTSVYPLEVFFVVLFLGQIFYVFHEPEVKSIFENYEICNFTEHELSGKTNLGHL